MSMRVILLLSLSAITPILFGLPKIGAAGPTADARRSIQADYDHMDAAAARKDLHGVVAYNAPSYVQVGRHGPTGTADQVRTTAVFFRAAQSLRGHSTVQRIVLRGKTATVVVRRQESFVVAVPDPKTRRHSHYVIEALSQETWTQGASGWLRTRSERLSETARKDGVPVAASH